MNERETAEYIAFLNRGGITPGLSRVRELLTRLGNPQEGMRFVHIAGTNGKGSVLAYLSAILQKAGCRTGRFSSPAVEDAREVIAVNGRPISRKLLCEGMTRIRGAVAGMVPEAEDAFTAFREGEESGSLAGASGREGSGRGGDLSPLAGIPSAFEAQTALALWFFREKGCEVAVIETGMGGLEDATNVIPAPEVCVLAKIGMDHTAFLGKTLPEIARQKAGILKPGSRAAVLLSEEEAVREVIRKAAEDAGGVPVVWTDPARISHIRYGLERQTFDYAGFRRLEIRLAGAYQIANAALAVDAALMLAEPENAAASGSKSRSERIPDAGRKWNPEREGRRGFSISEEALRAGLREAAWRGRFTVLSKRPLLVADGAHNADAARELARSIEIYFANRRILYIMGVLRDKDVPGIVEATARYAEHIFTVKTPGNPRAMGSVELAEEVARANPHVTSTDSVEEALELSRLMAGPEDVILAFGSLSFLGRIMELAGEGGRGARSRRRG